MEEVHKQMIRKNLSTLVEHTDLDSLWEKLTGRAIISESKMTSIKAIEDAEMQKTTFYREVMKRGPSAFSALVDSLAESNQIDLAKCLNPTFERQSQMDLCIDGRLSIKIKTSSQHYLELLPQGSEAYEIDSTPRGYALIINNIHNGRAACKTAAEIDGENMRDLWTELGYTTQYHSNCCKDEFVTVITEFARADHWKKVSSCIVVIMGHGDEEGIETYNPDYDSVSYRWILEQFNNKNCLKLHEKPRVVFFNSCRGSVRDRGVSRLYADQDQDLSSDYSLDRISTHSDMFIYSATIPGYKAFTTTQGSYFVHAICSIFMEYACTMDLASMMERVTKEVHDTRKNHLYQQTVQVELQGVAKKLYFNPMHQ